MFLGTLFNMKNIVHSRYKSFVCFELMLLKSTKTDRDLRALCFRIYQEHLLIFNNRHGLRQHYCQICYFDQFHSKAVYVEISYRFEHILKIKTLQNLNSPFLASTLKNSAERFTNIFDWIMFKYSEKFFCIHMAIKARLRKMD